MADVERRVDPIQGEILHVYDGIEEADNQLPLWWLWTFYLAIGFAVFYWIAFHELKTMPLPMEAYSKALQERASGGEVSEELLTALVSDPDAVGQGQTLFNDNCVVCHEARGQGKIGPNLTDDYWIHGGGPIDIHHTISEGVLDSGMPAWGGTLGADAVQKLAAFVMSIRGTHVEGKEPQGELWTGGSSGEVGDVDADDGVPDEPVDAVDEEQPVEGDEAEAAVDAAEEAGAIDGAEAEAADEALEAEPAPDAEDVQDAIGAEE